MPWDAGGDGTTFGTARALIGLRQGCDALRHGGLRWTHASDDALAYLRQTATESVLVLARRAPGAPVHLRLDGVVDGDGTPVNLYGGAEVRRGPDGTLILPGDGPTFQAWRV